MIHKELDWCEVLSRRRFVTASAKSLLGVGLGPMVGRSIADNSAVGAFTPRRARSVIYLNLMGGMSHIDTFDPKPESPDVQGPVSARATNVVGLKITEFLPRMAGLMDKVAVLRSITSNQGSHPAAQYLLHRSYSQGGTISHPTLAAWAMRCLGKLNPDLPGSISIASNDDSVSTGFLGPEFAALPIGAPKEGLPNTMTPEYVGESRFERRLSLAQSFNAEFQSQYNYRQSAAHGSMFAEAIRLMKSDDLKAFDIDQEPRSIHNLYGRNSFGQGCLLARRLVEHSVRFVEVGLGGWDTHYDNFTAVAEKATTLDQGLSALLGDLGQRGMLDETMVVVGTEFGRTPQILAAHKNGRDHHPKAFTCLLAGGGVGGGQVYGATDPRGAEVVDKPMAISDLNATIAWGLGLPVDEEFAASTGQLFRIADDGQPVVELFS